MTATRTPPRPAAPPESLPPPCEVVCWPMPDGSCVAAVYPPGFRGTARMTPRGIELGSGPLEEFHRATKDEARSAAFFWVAMRQQQGES